MLPGNHNRRLPDLLLYFLLLPPNFGKRNELMEDYPTHHHHGTYGMNKLFSHSSRTKYPPSFSMYLQFYRLNHLQASHPNTSLKRNLPPIAIHFHSYHKDQRGLEERHLRAMLISIYLVLMQSQCLLLYQYHS